MDNKRDEGFKIVPTPQQLGNVKSVNIGNMIYIYKNKIVIKPLKIVIMTEEEYKKISREDEILGEEDET